MRRAFLLAEKYLFRMIHADKNAFTLAEVLITLGIIGVVAAMTLPALINKTKNKELHTAFLKTYSEAGLFKADYGISVSEYMSNQKLNTAGLTAAGASSVFAYFKGAKNLASNMGTIDISKNTSCAYYALTNTHPTEEGKDYWTDFLGEVYHR